MGIAENNMETADGKGLDNYEPHGPGILVKVLGYLK